MVKIQSWRHSMNETKRRHRPESRIVQKLLCLGVIIEDDVSRAIFFDVNRRVFEEIKISR